MKRSASTDAVTVDFVQSAATIHRGHIPFSLGYCAIFVLLGLGANILGPTLTMLASTHGTTTEDMAWIIAGHALGNVFGGPTIGFLLDRRPVENSGNLISCLLLLCTLCQFSMWASPNAGVAMLSYAVLGFAHGGLNVAGQTLMSWLHAPEPGWWLNIMNAMFGVGSCVAPILAALSTSYFYTSLNAFPMIGLVAFVLALTFKYIRFKKPVVDEEGKDATTPSAGLQWAKLGPMALFFLSVVCVEVTYGSWIYTYSTTELKLPPHLATSLTTAFFGAFTAGRLLIVLVKSEPHQIIRMMLTLGVGSILLILTYPTSLPVLFLGTFGLGLANASMYPQGLTLLNKHTEVSGQAISVLVLSANSGAIAGPQCVGQIAKYGSGYGSLFGVSLVSCVVAFLALEGFLLAANSAHSNLAGTGKMRRGDAAV